jgi:hypothetical protein
MLQATWGDLYKNKEDIDWCTENFAWFEDRLKCITYEHCTFAMSASACCEAPCACNLLLAACVLYACCLAVI